MIIYKYYVAIKKLNAACLSKIYLIRLTYLIMTILLFCSKGQPSIKYKKGIISTYFKNFL